MFISEAYILVKEVETPLMLDTRASDTFEIGASKDKVNTTRFASIRLDTSILDTSS